MVAHVYIKVKEKEVRLETILKQTIVVGSDCFNKKAPILHYC